MSYFFQFVVNFNKNTDTRLYIFFYEEQEQDLCFSIPYPLGYF